MNIRRIQFACRRACHVGAWVVASSMGLPLPGVLAQNWKTPFEGVPEGDIAKMKEAAPAKAGVQPKKERKVLVFWKCEGFPHGSIPWCNKAMEILGQKTGAYAVEFSNDKAVFSADRLAGFDGVLFNNTTDLKFDDAQKKALLDFVRAGKGVIGIHAASDNFKDWPEGAALIGGIFDGHPWTAGGTWGFKLDEPDHPIVKGFEGKGFTLSDEIYQFKAPYTRADRRVLVSLDLSHKETGAIKGGRSDNDYAVSWIRMEGKGRVFFCSLGHNNHVFWTPGVMRHYLDGIQWALGDLEADATPKTACLMDAAPVVVALCQAAAPAPVAEDPFAKLTAYKYGDDRAPLAAIEELVRNTPPSGYAALEKKLVAVLANTSATPDAREFACRQLRMVGSGACVADVVKLLPDAKLNHMALYALQGNPSDEASKALREQAAKLPPALRIGVVAALGSRRDAKAVAVISDSLKSDNADLAAAALNALADIGTKEAAEAIAEAAVAEALKAKRDEALLKCADRLAASGDENGAVRLLGRLMESGDANAKAAALNVMVRVRGDKAAADVLKLFRGDDVRAQKAVAPVLATLKSGEIVRQLAGAIDGMKPEAQVMVLTAIAARGDAANAAAATKLAESPDESVRMAAIRALGAVGSGPSVALLLKAAAQKGAAGEEAVKSLSVLNVKGVDEALMDVAKSSEAVSRAVAIDALQARNSRAVLPLLLDPARHADAEFNKAACAALKNMAQPGDVSALVVLWEKSPAPAAKVQVERTLASVAERCKAEASVRRIILDNAQSRQGAERLVFIKMAGKIPSDETQALLKKILADPDETLRKAAVNALSDWPDESSSGMLMDVAKNDASEVVRILAVQGGIQVVQRTKAPPREVVKKLQALMGVAARVEEKKLILEALPKVDCKEAIEFAKASAADQALKDTAEQVLKKLDGKK